MRSVWLRSVALIAGLHLVWVTSPAFGQGPTPYNPSQPQPLPSAPPPAAPPPPTAPAGKVAATDIIYLKNGGILRGTLIDAIPGAHARIQLATGEIATVQWADIGRIEHSTSPPPGQPQQPSGPPQAPPKPAAPPPPMVDVHIDSPKEVLLQGRPDEDYEWMDFCHSPCDKLVRTDWEFRIVASGSKSSSTFQFDEPPGSHVLLTVDPASKTWFILGAVGLGVGAIAGLYGLLFLFIGSLANDTATTSSTTTASDKKVASDFTGVGLGLTIVGVGLIVTGCIAMGSNWSTTTTRETVDKRSGSDAWRSPVWREPTAFDRALPPPTFATPIFRTTF